VRADLTFKWRKERMKKIVTVEIEVRCDTEIDNYDIDRYFRDEFNTDIQIATSDAVIPDELPWVQLYINYMSIR
jgi:hypothetical protein